MHKSLAKYYLLQCSEEWLIGECSIDDGNVYYQTKYGLMGANRFTSVIPLLEAIKPVINPYDQLKTKNSKT